MVKEIEIPEGYKAKIVDNKVVLKLKESEDERIRKEIILFIRANMPIYRISDERKMVAWIEKQKERGPLTKEEEYTLARIIEYVEDNDCPAEWKNLLHDIYSLPYVKPAEWSKEDEKFFQLLHAGLYAMKVKIGKDEYDKAVERLKSLRPQPHWKPSEEKKKETLDGADIGYGLETAIDILKNGFMHYQTDDGEYERKQALDVLIFLLNETRKKRKCKVVE